MATVSLQNLSKRYGDLEVVHGISLDIADREFVALVGPSGCGKSTTLRMIAGLEEVSGGTILIGGREVNDLPPRERNISMVFQSYALYPHMSVRENMGFSLKIAKRPQAEIDQRVNEAAQILSLGELMDRRPSQLSGGQRQRVAMGRAIVRHPEVFLFDEPLSNLDAKLRTQMRTEIKKLHSKVQSTVVYVTHDQVEAMTLADRIVIMRVLPMATRCPCLSASGKQRRQAAKWCSGCGRTICFPAATAFIRTRTWPLSSATSRLRSPSRSATRRSCFSISPGANGWAAC
jgi:multiple sugar transport system ATP-binding protein